jgi:ABC-type Fe3+-citrate transport system substrate-binding protein
VVTREKSNIEILLEALKAVNADNMIIASYRDISEIKNETARLLRLIEEEEKLRGY